ncbi:U11/U12 small nuclear ribonucleoprotein 48 kDa protein-like [Anthonomus grandis grandis]|uniref:U11/U12 small nuclear ribonucleoprotein 48 kDa protein-like n=1 Tax=Anthonomus grandis grandis TaxID=2921223 RepID=UPI002165D012|nr:U11/U12 small nuclear ribonucleoprotein 48 kDa protein-like [Anthonomus grandis grandis]
MDFNLEIRKKQLQSLKQYIASSEESVKAVFKALDWTIPKTLQNENPMVSCPFNPKHLVSEKTYAKHLEKCNLSTAGYTEKDNFLSDPPEESDATIKLSNAKKIEILTAARASRSDFKPAWNGKDPDPLTADRYTSTFSVDERLALYDYTVKHTKPPPKPHEFTLEFTNSKEAKQLTDEEKLILERNAKRRRTKYKSVHTSKKSYTEITREVIDNQMGLYVEWIKHKQELEKKEKERLKRLAKEKLKKPSTVVKETYHHITTTYDQQSTMPWDYYNAIPTGSNQVITDWSQLYKAGIEADYYSNNDQEPTEYLASDVLAVNDGADPQLLDYNCGNSSLKFNDERKSDKSGSRKS